MVVVLLVNVTARSRVRTTVTLQVMVVGCAVVMVVVPFANVLVQVHILTITRQLTEDRT